MNVVPLTSSLPCSASTMHTLFAASESTRPEAITVNAMTLNSTATHGKVTHVQCSFFSRLRTK